MSSSQFKSKRPFVSKAELLSRSVKAPQIGTSRKYPVLIALDDSGSMSGAPFTGALAASIELGQELAKPENLDAFQVALMLFEGVARTAVPFTPASSFQVPGGLAATGPGTDFTVALNHAKSILEPVGAPESTPERPTLVFLTDGQHVASSDPAPVAAEVKSMANVVCIAFGPGADLGLLTLLASSPSCVTRATTGNELRAYFAAIGRTLSKSRRAGVSLAASAADPFASRRR